MSKQYHFGVVATFDEDTLTWEFQAMPINGDETPFFEMQEVYNYDTYEWEDAFIHYEPDGYAEQRANFILLMEAIEHANHRLKEAQ